MLNIKDLDVSIDGKHIIKSLNMDINLGELHVIMGPNGSGKSTLANTIAGKQNYTVEKGDILYKDESILDLSPEERVCKGLFVSFQYPMSLPGVNNIYFLKEAVNSIRKYNNQKEIDSVSFLKLIREKLKLVDFDESFMHRSVNDGFSGGEKKRNEILQLLMIEPELAILDETDSGLDIDALKTIASGINSFHNSKKSIILITHYQRILQYLNPDKVHILYDGNIIMSGTIELASTLEKKGYKWLKDNV